MEVLALHFNNPKSHKFKLEETVNNVEKDRIENGDKRKRSSTFDFALPPVKQRKETPETETTKLESDTNQTTLETLQVDPDVTDLVEELLVKVSQVDLDSVPNKSTQRANYLTNVVPHGDYLHYKNSNLSMSNCSICSKDVCPTVKLSCSICPNIMHRDCSGFGKLQLDYYCCPLCSMKEVNRIFYIVSFA